jgi:hypothetical protein
MVFTARRWQMAVASDGANSPRRRHAKRPCEISDVSPFASQNRRGLKEAGDRSRAGAIARSAK